MKEKISLPDLRNPVNSNFNEDSFTGNTYCSYGAVAAFLVGVGTYVLEVSEG